MPDAPEPASRTVQLQNNAPGNRYVHSDGSPVNIPRGTVSEPLNVLEADLAELPDGVTVYEPKAVEAPAAPEAELAPGGGADLHDPSTADGLRKKAELVAIAEAEGVAFDGNETKADIAAKIIAHRRAAA